MPRSYSELLQHYTLEDRFKYLSLRGRVGEATFGFDRYVNQQFYRSAEWKHVRQQIILRDEGCDLGLPGYEIHGKIIIHHMNPMLLADLVEGDDSVLDPEYLICVTLPTHNAIHYGDVSLLSKPFVERRPGDTALWTRRY
jgi:hypothetical protein